MTREYTALPVSPVPRGAGFAAPQQALAARVTLDDAALSAMTDLTRVSAVIIRPTDSVDEALNRMRQRGVRLLLVVDTDRRVEGLITANDVLGEKPMRFVEASGVRHAEIQVKDIMTAADRLEAIPLSSVASAKVGHVVATLRDAGRQHALVVEPDGAGGSRVRGIFSATQIARQLGIDESAIQPMEIARTFAEIEASLMH